MMINRKGATLASQLILVAVALAATLCGLVFLIGGPFTLVIMVACLWVFVANEFSR